jgi:hypothetical protein
MEVMFTGVLTNQQKEATLNMMVRLPHLIIMVMVTHVTIRSTINLMVNAGIHQNAKYVINLVTLLSIAHSSTPVMPRLIVPPHHKPRILNGLLTLLLLTISPVILQNYLFIPNMMVLMRLSLVMNQVCVFHILDH